ncbi:MAG TPA: cation:dicarboxylase symporter family transporter, partial [Candidatus Acidoferrales bacterium]|nr:cation:dicarboxylase symporter family transporter [Candidatus Acidoferrales bacterium]
MKLKILVAAFAAVFLAAALSLGQHFSWYQLSPDILLAARWVAIALFGVYAARRRSLTGWILLGMAAGVEFGHDWPATAVKLQVCGTIFLRLIKVIIAPLLFSTLVVGIAGHADLKKVGRMGAKALIYFEVVSTLALLIGFVAINISRAGEGVRMPAGAQTQNLAVATHSATEIIENIFPENIAKSVAEGEVLQIVVFSVLFGLALAMVPEAKRRPLLNFAESLAETMFKFTNIVMLAAPIGVFGAIAYTVGHMGLGVLMPLLKLLATMYVALGFFVFCVLLPIALIIRAPLKRFLRAVAEPVTIAFATASSEAALPIAMEKMESIGVPRETVAFVLPTGYSF